jgi:hypothetical protein
MQCVTRPSSRACRVHPFGRAGVQRLREV